jgi:flotillin
MYILIAIVVLAAMVFLTFIAAMSRYKRCPSDKILVIYGKVGRGRAAKCIHGGAAFVWPLIQDFRFLDLTPMTIDINLKSALSRQNIRVNVPSRFTIGVSTTTEVMALAAERLLSMDRQSIEENAKDIIFGQLRATIATMDIEEINADRENFEKKVMDNVETELQKIGLKLINVNITDITDESNYIAALGKKAAAEATNQARIEVAQQDRDGATGEAEARREQRINVADANAKAVEGENKSKIDVAKSDAERREAEAEATRRGEAAEKSKTAEALAQAYQAERAAELKRAEREQATREADVIIPAEIAKKEKVIRAEADKDKAVLESRARSESMVVEANGTGEATVVQAKANSEATVVEGRAKGQAIQAEMEGRAKGIRSILQEQAMGLSDLVNAAQGDPAIAIQFIIANNLEKLMAIQVEAIKGIAIDKVMVWDQGGNGNGKTATANFISGMASSLPPMQELMKMGGLDLPEWMGKAMDVEEVTGPRKPALETDKEDDPEPAES